MPLSPFYGNVNVVDAYEQAKARNQAAEMQQLQGYGTLQKILQGQQALRIAAEEAKLKVAQGQQIGSGLRMPDGTIIAPPERPAAPKEFAPPELLVLTDRLAKLPAGDPTRPYVEARIKYLTERQDRQPPQEPAPVVQTDEEGNVHFFDRKGNLLRTVPKGGKPSAEYAKRQAAQRKLQVDLNAAIGELEKAVAPGGLIEKSTGSGAGALVDIGAAFFGHATEGAKAVGQIQPIFDMVLKMVPRFEGPQSDKDTLAYKEAAGQLANPNIPNPQKKEAAKTILRLMKARRGQFSSAAPATTPQASEGWEDL